MEDRARRPENDLLLRAIEKFAATTGVPIRIVAEEYQIAPGRRIDALVNVETAVDQHPYAVEIKRNMNTARLGMVAAQLKVAPYKGMLVTDYVNPNMAERLREMDIAFIDLAGNAYLNEPPIFVYVKGNRPPEKRTLGPELKPTRAFQATGIKVLFGFLVNPDLLNRNYRDIAKVTDVALGTVGWVLTDLRDHGYLVEKGRRHRRLIRKQQLIDQWVEAYPEKLRPKLRLGRYRADDPAWWRGVDIAGYDGLWGGEIAAAKLTGYLQPEIATVYTHEIPAKLLLEHRLKKDPDGNVELLQQFWHPTLLTDTLVPLGQHLDTVPELLIYADLLGTAEDRNIETAKLIYDEYLHRHIGID